MLSENRENDVFCVVDNKLMIPDPLTMSRFVWNPELTEYLNGKCSQAFLVSNKTYSEGYQFDDPTTLESVRQRLTKTFGLTEVSVGVFLTK